jgi:hypothetical protein
MFLTHKQDEEMVRFATMQKEELFLACDEATRRTGRLVKAITVGPVLFHSLFSVLF